MEETPVEREKQREEPRVTSAEVIRRVNQANAQFFEFGDQRENWAWASGAVARIFGLTRLQVLVVPDVDPAPDRLYFPESGNVRILGHDAANEHISEHVFRLGLDEFEKQMKVVEGSFRGKGHPFSFYFDRPHPKSSAGRGVENSMTECKMTLLAGVGEQVSVDLLRSYSPTTRRSWKEEDMFARYDAVLKQKHGIIIELGPMEQTTWERPVPVFQKGNIVGEKTEDYGCVKLFINIPYNTERDIDQSLALVNDVFQEMTSAGLFPLEDGEPFDVRFDGTAKEAKPLAIAMTNVEYQRVVDRLAHRQDGSVEQSDGITSFPGLFSKDLRRVKFLPFEQAVRRTRQWFGEHAVGDDLIARYELCEIAQDRDGAWQILLPAGDYMPLEDDYRNPYLHSRIEETWGGERASLMQQIENAGNGKKPIRGYVIEFASGKRIVVTDVRHAESTSIVEQLPQSYGIEDVSPLFERIATIDQLEKALLIDTEILRRAGANDADRRFYEHWWWRLYGVRDAHRETLQDKVLWRFQDLEEKIFQFRQHHLREVT